VNVYDTDGSTALSSVTVRLRNNDSNELLTLVTDSAGQVIFNLGNLSLGWTRGDTITVFVVYQIFEAYETFTTPSTGGGTTLSLTLATVSTPTQLRYFTPDEFLRFFRFKSYDDDSERGLKVMEIVQVGIGVEAEIDQMTEGTWDDNDGNYHTATLEYHDVPDYWTQETFLDHKPVSSVTTVQVNTVSDGSAENWITLTATTDYETDLNTGCLTLHASTFSPAKGVRQVRVTYKYGVATPNDIKTLAILMTGKKFLLGGLVRNNALGHSEFNVANLEVLDREIKKYVDNRRYIHLINA